MEQGVAKLPMNAPKPMNEIPNQLQRLEKNLSLIEGAISGLTNALSKVIRPINKLSEKEQTRGSIAKSELADAIERSAKFAEELFKRIEELQEGLDL